MRACVWCRWASASTEEPELCPPWTTRIWLEYRAGNLTRAARDVLLTLHTYRSTGGACWPSHETLAERARCCARTVGRALAVAQGLGLVSWVERRVHAGWRWLRTSNLYRLTVPATSVQLDPRLCGGALGPHRIGRIARPILTTGLNSRGGESLRKKEALNELLRAAAAAPDLLAARRAAMEGGEGARLASFAR